MFHSLYLQIAINIFLRLKKRRREVAFGVGQKRLLLIDRARAFGGSGAILKVI